MNQLAAAVSSRARRHSASVWRVWRGSERQPYSITMASENGHADLGLEPEELAVDRGGGDVEALGRAPDRAGSGGLVQITQDNRMHGGVQSGITWCRKSSTCHENLSFPKALGVQ
jgi:hypothetical protein